MISVSPLFPGLTRTALAWVASGFAALALVVSTRADTASVVTAANALLSTSTAGGASPTVSTTYSLTTDKQWTNLPGGTRD